MITPIIGHGIVHADFDLTKRYGGWSSHWDYIYLSKNGWKLVTYMNLFQSLELSVHDMDDSNLDPSIKKYHVGRYTKITEHDYRFDIWAPVVWEDLNIQNDCEPNEEIGYGILYDCFSPEEFKKDFLDILEAAYISCYRETYDSKEDTRIRATFNTNDFETLDMQIQSYHTYENISEEELDFHIISGFKFDHYNKETDLYYFRFKILSQKVDKSHVHGVSEVFLIE